MVNHEFFKKNNGSFAVFDECSAPDRDPDFISYKPDVLIFETSVLLMDVTVESAMSDSILSALKEYFYKYDLSSVAVFNSKTNYCVKYQTVKNDIKLIESHENCYLKDNESYFFNFPDFKSVFKTKIISSEYWYEQDEDVFEWFNVYRRSDHWAQLDRHESMFIGKSNWFLRLDQKNIPRGIEISKMHLAY